MSTEFRPFEEDEHARFLEGLQKFGAKSRLSGREWQQIATTVSTPTSVRNVDEVKLHGYRYFAALQAVVPQQVVETVNEQLQASTPWTLEEDLILDNGVAAFDEADPQRWAKIASLLPGKSEPDVEKRYQKLMMDVVRIELGEAGGRVGS
mmetsp:Transcript_10262/g.21643  ORF Transcript_10262/g.21643 Transcript_10262/m.21643 type:complete len:150 (-) Transcript_10262:53-502(-)|eukprot:CAMPEP_0119469998 /NCGR_PEP_ID=MMETSP1344-20130328/3084_1 /TAXON_ID=236787 /ORGANISM="Florenciella parvula, Strain CCMP2471" /LENGTH=149 /DNA_ID=CAMNT_0007502613 /DNA_START=152 /DNA_END=601 /DNA_ORIENTATION=+